MLLGQYLFKGGGITIYGPTFPRGGLGAIFTACILQMLGTPTLTITVEHKNIEDTTWTTLGTFSSITTLGNYTKDLSNIKEQVRFAYMTTGTNDWEGFLVNMTAPAWRPYA